MIVNTIVPEGWRSVPISRPIDVYLMTPTAQTIRDFIDSSLSPALHVRIDGIVDVGYFHG
jgi:hypothetical protein